MAINVSKALIRRFETALLDLAVDEGADGNDDALVDAVFGLARSLATYTARSEAGEPIKRERAAKA